MFASTIAMLLSFAGAASPNVLFLTVDTLRPDHLGCYGYERTTSPSLDLLAKGSLVFEDCIVEQPQTGPSFCAMMTSQHPRVTGAVRNGVPLPEAIPTVVQRFQEAGYQTGAVVSNWNLRRDLSGLAKGFEQFHDDFGDNFLGMTRSEMDAEEVNKHALRMVRNRDEERPFFFWVHYMEPHGPYRSHWGFKVHDEPLRKMESREQAKARYDSEIAYADHHIGELLEAVPEENTYIFFVADHGESLYEHNYVGHTREVYQQTVHVPLMISGPGIKAGRTNMPAMGVDVAPTLLGLADLDGLPVMTGVDLLNDPPSAGRERISETYDAEVPDGEHVHAVLADKDPSRQAVIHEEWKLIVREGAYELYNLSRDPMEERNIAEEYPEHVRELRSRIESWNTRVPRNIAEGAELDEDDMESLEALGYLE